jgi:hypothetical protein
MNHTSLPKEVLLRRDIQGTKGDHVHYVHVYAYVHTEGKWLHPRRRTVLVSVPYKHDVR